ncbi:outer membrane protein assembly factor BamC [Suttonella sp. R2A3]|uniref:outer membrane protein assembly factor BamC n=1 Tax=Suttonella sp. R2A3 TaxID=2908648 RepID=UPI001F378818|nr:outer membrane protein assembly factor BamC [Suttonella sp. R2A3]UJF23912.1 outer membrane protein assembly factor BamC [Suttonella sp. R2A3]
MQPRIYSGLAVTFALLLSACSSGNLNELIPDRRPDYRSSSMVNALEVPPDLTGATIDNTLAIPDLNPSAIASYNAYAAENVTRDQRGYIAVLPQLEGVDVVETPGQLPYIVVNAPPEKVWQAVRRYWSSNGIRLTVNEPAIGLMETDWLVDETELPQTGISGILNSLLSFVSDSGTRDRYRIRFGREAGEQTSVTLLYQQSVEKADYDLQSGKEPAGFKWTLSDNDNPELQLEMTRRIALFIANELKRSQPEQAQDAGNAVPAVNVQLGQLQDGTNALVFNSPYQQAWRVLGIALDKASFAIEKADYTSGSYLVQYQPQSEVQQDPGFWSRLWGSEPSEQAPANPYFLVRLADQGKQSVAVVQTENGAPAPTPAAQNVLESLYAVL